MRPELASVCVVRLAERMKWAGHGGGGIIAGAHTPTRLFLNTCFCLSAASGSSSVPAATGI